QMQAEASKGTIGNTQVRYWTKRSGMPYRAYRHAQHHENSPKETFIQHGNFPFCDGTAYQALQRRSAAGIPLVQDDTAGATDAPTSGKCSSTVCTPARAICIRAGVSRACSAASIAASVDRVAGWRGTNRVQQS